MDIGFSGGIAPGVETMLSSAAGRLRGRLSTALNQAAEEGRQSIADDSPGVGNLAASWRVAEAQPEPLMKAEIQSGLMGRVALQGETAGQPFNIARAMEYGTPAHSIAPVNAEMLAFQPSREGAYTLGEPTEEGNHINVKAIPPQPEDGVIFTEHVEHPGTPPHSMVRNNIFSTMRAARNAVRDALEEGIAP